MASRVPTRDSTDARRFDSDTLWCQASSAADTAPCTSLAAQRFITPQRFARRFFVYNYCPLAFLSETGSNLTPDKLKRAETTPLFAACDRMLRQVIAEVEPEWLVGIGAFAETRIRQIFASEVASGAVRVGRIPHPSPASPAANKGWEKLADAAFAELGIVCE